MATEGTDDEDEVDIFNDGVIVPNINLVEYFKPLGFSPKFGKESWRWGPAFGFGLSAPASDSEDNSKSPSSASVIRFSAGPLAEFPVSKEENGSVIGVEFGYARGYSTDEGIGDIADGAKNFGLGFDIKWG